MADPNTQKINPPAGSIGAAVEETKAFFQEPLAKKYAELEEVVAELEAKLGGVLKGLGKEADKAILGAKAILRNDQDSPLYSLVQDVKQEAHAVHDRYEYIRNKISGLIDRLHI